MSSCWVVQLCMLLLHSMVNGMGQIPQRPGDMKILRNYVTAFNFKHDDKPLACGESKKCAKIDNLKVRPEGIFVDGQELVKFNEEIDLSYDPWTDVDDAVFHFGDSTGIILRYEDTKLYVITMYGTHAGYRIVPCGSGNCDYVLTEAPELPASVPDVEDEELTDMSHLETEETTRELAREIGPELRNMFRKTKGHRRALAEMPWISITFLCDPRDQTYSVCLSSSQTTVATMNDILLKGNVEFQLYLRSVVMVDDSEFHQHDLAIDSLRECGYLASKHLDSQTDADLHHCWMPDSAFEYPILGIAWFAGRDGISNNLYAPIAAFVSVHEIAHQLGAPHDEEIFSETCKCEGVGCGFLWLECCEQCSYEVSIMYPHNGENTKPVFTTLSIGMMNSYRSESQHAYDEDCNWQCYLDRYPDLQDVYGPNNVEAAEEHWVNYGKDEGRDCTCEYQCNWLCYLDRYPDLQDVYGPKNVIAAEEHWNSHGSNEGRDCTCA